MSAATSAWTEEELAQVTDKAVSPLAEGEDDSPLPGPKDGPKDWKGFWLGVDYVIFNTHVGQGVRNGGLAWIIKTWKPDVIVMQEVKNVDLSRWRDDWHVVYHGTNALMARRSVFDLVESGGPDIRFGSQYSRNRVFAVLAHRELKRLFYIQDAHLDPLWGQPDISKVRDKDRLASHMKQGQTYIDWQSKGGRRGAVQGDGGDFNELVTTGHLKGKSTFLGMSMPGKYARLGMFPASQTAERNSGPARIDDFFFMDVWYHRVVSRRSVDLRQEFKGLDHNTVLVRTQVCQRRRWSRAARRLVN